MAEPASPLLSVEGFEGPLDFLLDLLRRQRVDLGALSIAALTGQLVTALEDGAARVPLERRGDWLVMASQLVLLKSQLLAGPAAAAAAQAEAGRRLEQLQELARMRIAAGWLGARPQLGGQVFARGAPERPVGPPRSEAVLRFLEAVLAMLEGPPAPGAVPAPAYAPPQRALWRVPDALARIRALLPESPAPRPLVEFLPRPPRAGALASTFVAALELVREGEVQLAQPGAFAPITLRPAAGPG